jgi:hypothetical protein
MATAGSSYTTNQLTADTLLDISDWAQDNYLMPVEIKGGKYYILCASKKQATHLLKTQVTGSLTNVWTKSGTHFEEIKDMIPQLIAIFDNFLIVRDERAATVILTGAGLSSYGQTFGFMQMGRADGRTKLTGAAYFDVNALYAKNSLIKYEPAMPSFKEQKDDYGRDQGTMLVGAFGYQTRRFSLDSDSDSDKMQQEGCALILTNRN